MNMWYEAAGDGTVHININHGGTAYELVSTGTVAWGA